jgi:hypothetical protein
VKICVIADATAIHTIRYIEYFLKLGHEIHLITYKPPSNRIDGVNLYVICVGK